MRACCALLATLLLPHVRASAQDEGPPTLAYRFEIGRTVVVNTEASVESGYGDFLTRHTLEIRALKRFPDGGHQLSVTLTYLRESSIIDKDRNLFDSSQEPKAGEDEEYTALRKIINKPLCSMDIAPDGTLSRVIFSEDAHVLWKAEGAGTLERARDFLGAVLPKVTGRPATAGDSWTEERNPIGHWVPLALRFTWTVENVDPKSKAAIVVLKGNPEAGASPTKIRKFELRNATGNMAFDGAAGRLRSIEMTGYFIFAEGEGDLATETSYKFKVKTTVRQG